MKRLLIIGASAAGFFILTGSIVSIWYFNSSNNSNSTVNQGFSSEEKSLHHTENGMEAEVSLSQTVLEPGEELNVKALIRNVSGGPFHYNGRCGVPIGITATATDESMTLFSEDFGEACADIYDPDDIRTFEDGDVIEKETTIYPEIPINYNALNPETIDAPEGIYKITVSFRTEENNKIMVEEELHVNNTDSPIMSKERAVQEANDHPEVQAWMEEHENSGIEEEKHFFSENKWIIMYHTEEFSSETPEPGGKRIVIHVHAETGEVDNIFAEDYTSESGM